MSRIDKSGEGVCVRASTLGSLEALLEFLKSPAVNIPVSGISIGPVHKKDVMRASVMLERKKKEYATILAFDVKVTPEGRELADETGVRIFMADIIHHLFDQFKAYMKNLKEEKKREAAEEAVFPCVLKIIPGCVFNKKDPIVLGVDILEGIAKVGTPLCVPSREYVDIGRIASIEVNHKAVDIAKKGQKVATAVDDENPVQVTAATKKNKKKGQKVIDDEEYGIVPEPSESKDLNSVVEYAPGNNKHTTGEVQEEAMLAVEEETTLSNKKSRGKNDKKGMAEVNGAPETCDVDTVEVSIPGKMKGKKGKKGLKIDDDEFDVSAFEERSPDPPQEALQVEPKFMGKKKGKKSKQDGNDDSIVQGNHQNGFEPVDTVPASTKNKKSVEKLKGDMFSLLASYDGVLDSNEEESPVAEHADVVST